MSQHRHRLQHRKRLRVSALVRHLRQTKPLYAVELCWHRFPALVQFLENHHANFVGYPVREYEVCVFATVDSCPGRPVCDIDHRVPSEAVAAAVKVFLQQRGSHEYLRLSPAWAARFVAA